MALKDFDVIANINFSDHKPIRAIFTHFQKKTEEKDISGFKLHSSKKFAIKTELLQDKVDFGSVQYYNQYEKSFIFINQSKTQACINFVSKDPTVTITPAFCIIDPRCAEKIQVELMMRNPAWTSQSQDNLRKSIQVVACDKNNSKFCGIQYFLTYCSIIYFIVVLLSESGFQSFSLLLK